MSSKRVPQRPRAPSQNLHSFNFFYTTDIKNQNFQLRVAHFEGKPKAASFSEVLGQPNLRFAGRNQSQTEVYITCQLYAEGAPLGLATRSRFHPFDLEWNEWVPLPVKYADLPPSTLVAITVWEIHGPRQSIPIGGTTFALFGRTGVMRRGRQKLFLWPNVEADPRQDTSTPSFLPATHTESDRLERCMRRYDRGEMVRLPWLDALSSRHVSELNQREALASEKLYLFIELPQFDHPLVCTPEEDVDENLLPPHLAGLGRNHIVRVHDADVEMENPIEVKHRRLARSHRKGVLDRALKMNTQERKHIEMILRQPPTQQMTSEEKDLLWKFRFAHVKEPRALTKFLKCVDWTDQQEIKEATELLESWVPIPTDEALELLSAAFRNNAVVRKYAVSVIQKADDSEMGLYLLQLVQALRYEAEPAEMSPLAQLLIDRCIVDFRLGIQLWWYLKVELEDRVHGTMFEKVVKRFQRSLQAAGDEGHNINDVIQRQGELVAKLNNVVRTLKASREKDRPKKIIKLRQMLSEEGDMHELTQFQALPLPLDTNAVVDGINGEDANIFKSALNPLALTFRKMGGGTYATIFKSGDDPRQDQLVIQIITLMDKLLRKEHFDLKLTPYRVLALSSNDGLMECIRETRNMSQVLKSGSILEFLRHHRPDPEGPYGVMPEVLDTFVKSCAGYCVITYILSIGDRHLDNILMAADGRMFHIDFGFILGNDPKPFPPAIKLTKEMVEGMGGYGSKYYRQFITCCCESFNILRKSSKLILNLFALMVDANIPDLSSEPIVSLGRVQSNFRLDLTDEEAIPYFQSVINESTSALAPRIMENFHVMAQFLRS